MEQVRLDIQVGAPEDRGCLPELRTLANMCVLVNLESVVCVPALVNVCLHQLKETMGLECLH